MEEHGPYPEINFLSPEWQTVKRWLGGELLEIYRKLASNNTSWEDTLALRGRASMIELMLNFDDIAADQPR